MLKQASVRQGFYKGTFETGVFRRETVYDTMVSGKAFF